MMYRTMVNRTFSRHDTARTASKEAGTPERRQAWSSIGTRLLLAVRRSVHFMILAS